MPIKRFFQLLLAIVICLSAGALGALFTSTEVPGWYATLVTPPLNPPSWVFGPVWTTLYVLMGIAAFLIWSKGFKRKDVRTALAVFAFQLVLNTLWSFLFFWPASDRACGRRYPRALDGDYRGNGSLLSSLALGRLVARAISPLGEFCDLSQHRYLALELTKESKTTNDLISLICVIYSVHSICVSKPFSSLSLRYPLLAQAVTRSKI